VNARLMRDPALWMWALLAPLPTLAGAGAVAAFFGSSFHSGNVGGLVFVGLVLLVCRAAYRQRPVYLTALLAGGAVACAAAFGIVLWMLASAPLG
jgi:hypothetical protein